MIVQLIKVLVFDVLERYYKLVILNTLRMLDHAHHYALHIFSDHAYHLLGNFDAQSHWNQLIGNFDFYLHPKSQLQLLFLDIIKTLQTCHFGKLGMLDYPHQKILVSICSKLSCLSACKKSTVSLASFLTCCREIANLLF